MNTQSFDEHNEVKEEHESHNPVPSDTRHPPQGTLEPPLITRRKPLARWLREPLVHFFVLGLAVFLLHSALDRNQDPPASDPFVVEISSADLEWMRTIFAKQMGREPTLEELRGQVHQLIREQILSREAVAMGLDEGDMVVRRRLAQKVEFLFKDLSNLTEPTEADLRAYFSQNREKYVIPPRVTFSQAYFNSDNHGAEGAIKAAELLIREDIDPGLASSRGDASMVPSGCTECSEADIRKQFGTAFAREVIHLKPGSWYGPIRSAYGIHAVYIHDRRDAVSPELDQVMDEVKNEWMLARQEEHTQRVYAEVRSRYRVMLEGLPYDADVDE